MLDNLVLSGSSSQSLWRNSIKGEGKWKSFSLWMSWLLTNNWVIFQSLTANGTLSFSEKMYIEFIFDTKIRGLAVVVQNQDGPQAVIFGKEYIVRMSSNILRHMPSPTQPNNIFETSFDNYIN
jgi:hypothetical protein